MLYFSCGQFHYIVVFYKKQSYISCFYKIITGIKVEKEQG